MCRKTTHIINSKMSLEKIREGLPTSSYIYIKFYIYIGHLTRLGTRNDVVVHKEFVADLEKSATIANQDVLFSKVAQQVGHFDNPWLIFSKYIDAVNENCTQAMLPKWENRLGGALEFMSTHCFSMSEAERVDPTLEALTRNMYLFSQMNICFI